MYRKGKVIDDFIIETDNERYKLIRKDRKRIKKYYYGDIYLNISFDESMSEYIDRDIAFNIDRKNRKISLILL